MTTRYDIERALERSNLPAPSRHIVLVLCTRMGKGSTAIPPEHSPSLSRLARGTGWNRRTIMRHLALLEEQDWITRHRPPPELARARYMTTVYVVHDPATLGTQDPGLEAQGASLGNQDPGLGTGRQPGRGAAARNQTESDQVSDQREIGLVIEILQERTGRRLAPEWAAKIRDELLARPGIRSRIGYLRRVLTTDPNPHRWLPVAEEPRGRCGRCQLPGHITSECPH